MVGVAIKQIVAKNIVSEAFREIFTGEIIAIKFNNLIIITINNLSY